MCISLQRYRDVIAVVAMAAVTVIFVGREMNQFYIARIRGIHILFGLQGRPVIITARDPGWRVVAMLVVTSDGDFHMISDEAELVH